MMNLIVIIFSFLFFYNKAFSCELKDGKYLSLSSPISVVLDELNLLNDPKLIGISVYHPVKENNIEKIEGGIFLSSKKIKKFEGATIFFDESRELTLNLKRSVEANLIEVKTRGVDAFTIVEENLNALSPYLKNCDSEVLKLKNKIDIIKKSLSYFSQKKILFFLGEVNKAKYPNYLVVHDLFIESLVGSNLIETYDSKLAYISYSEKLLKKYSEYLKIGLTDSKNNSLELNKLDEHHYNISYRGIFSPGLRQIMLLEQLKDKLFESKN